MNWNELIKITLNLLAGFLTLILSYILPVGGGGISLIFVLTVPITIGLSLIGLLIYWLLLKRQKTNAKNIVLLFTILINLFITFSMFPYA